MRKIDLQVGGRSGEDKDEDEKKGKLERQLVGHTILCQGFLSFRHKQPALRLALLHHTQYIQFRLDKLFKLLALDARCAREEE